MVHIYPKSYQELTEEGCKASRPEITTYNALKTLDNDWYVWHSVEWLNKERLTPGEADFLVFNPKIGFIILEVKGGEISYINYKWTIIYQDKISHKSPIKQAESSKYAFAKEYIRLAEKEIDPSSYLSKFKGKDVYPGIIWHGLVFPYSNFKEIMINNSVEIPNLTLEMIFDAKDFKLQANWNRDKNADKSPIQEYLENLFYKKKWNTFKPLEGEKLEKVKKFFIKMINPSIKTAFLMNTLLDEKRKMLKKVNLEQDLILKRFENKTWCMFRGSAGTGKTYIAIKKAISLYNEKKKVLFLCYNRELKYFISKTIANQYQIKPSKEFIISNIHSFLNNIFETHFSKEKEVELKEALFGDINGNLNQKKIKEEILQMKNEFGIKEDYLFDAIIVDEAQDIEEEFWSIIPEFLQNRERENSVFYIFFDMEQKKFIKKETPKKFGLNFDDDFPLFHNLRNSEEIINWIIKETNLGHYEKKSTIDGFQVKSYKPQKRFFHAIKIVASEIWKLFSENKINLEDIVVICDKQLQYIDKKYVIKKKNESKNDITLSHIKFNVTADTRLYFIEPQRNSLIDSIVKRNKDYENFVLFNGIGTFKGLEKDIVFIIIPNLYNKQLINHKSEYNKVLMDAYIAASRAKFMLFVVMYDEI